MEISDRGFDDGLSEQRCPVCGLTLDVAEFVQRADGSQVCERCDEQAQDQEGAAR